MRATLTSALAAGAAQLGSAVFAPLAAASEQLLDPVVNVQSSAGGTFTERALQLRLGGTAAVLNLASASVGPGAPASTPAPASAANPTPTVPRAQGVSPIKIDAGRAVARTGGQPWALTGLALLLIGTAGLVGRRSWRPRRG